MSKVKSITPLPPADFTPTLGDYKDLRPFRYWCQKVLPLVYDDSLSYYELLCKVVDYLNKTMEDVGVLHEDVDNLHTAYAELQNYVNSYFSTLDVQEEINNKLDEMAQSGYLSSIIAPIVINVAVPIFVDNMSDMTDKSRIYVLTTTGYVYIWNGTAWYNTGMNYTDNFVNYMQVVDTLADGTNANDITTNGFWNLSGGYTYTNLPITVGLFQVTNIKGVTYQIAVNGGKKNANYGQFWFRSAYGSPLEFGEWISYDRPHSIDTIGSVPAGTDLNNFTENGVYTIVSTNEVTNSPVTSGLLEVYHDLLATTFQIITSANKASAGARYARWLIGDNWTEWVGIIPRETLVVNTSSLDDNTDLNNISENGVWNLSGDRTYINTPEGTTIGQLMCCNISGVLYQTFISGRTSDLGTQWFRAYYSGSWKEWSVIHSEPSTYCNVYNPKVGGNKLVENGAVIHEFESGYYVNQTGVPADSDLYCRTKTLIPVPKNVNFLVKDSSIQNTIYVVYFDANFTYLGFSNIKNGVLQIPTVTPPECAYIGINYALSDAGEEYPTDLEIIFVNGANLLQVNNIFNVGKHIIRTFNRVINNNGTLSSESEEFQCLFIPYPNCKKVFCNFNSVNQCFCLNSKGENVTPTDFEQITPSGRVYTLPDDVALLGINLHQSGGKYATFMYDNNVVKNELEMEFVIPSPRINGKNIVCVGDSLTYLDQRTIDNTDRFMGYQSYLRMAGANVNSFGYSGKAYAQNAESTCIADTFVSAEPDLSNTDIVILFGGSNDVRLSTTIGTEQTDYSAKDIDSATFIGAIGKLINYCRTQNPEIEIFICTIMPSQDASRTYSKNKQYNDAIKSTALFWNVPVIDTFELCNWQPDGNFRTYNYDSTHPNEKGMRRIGKIMCSYIDHYMNIIG